MEEFSGVNIHVRSISLPSRLNHNSLKIETELNKLRTWNSSSAITSSEAINIGLDGLSELFNNVDDVIQTLHYNKHKNLVEQALDKSLKLLDACGMIRNLFVMMKEHVQNLQSALRRKGGALIIQSDIHAFLCCRKKVKNDVAKCLKTLKRTPLSDADESLALVTTNAINEVSEITLSIFRSVLLYLSVPEMKKKGYGWSLISKLMINGSSSMCSDINKRHVNEVGSVDLSIYTLGELVRRSDSKVNFDMEQIGLRKLDVSIKGIEERLDCVFRQLIRYRVSLLNILTS